MSTDEDDTLLPPTEQDRKRVLDELAAGRISSDEAITMLRGES
jgi:hypothetical protein